mgnify:FL=1
MKPPRYKIPYGKTELEFSLPNGLQVSLAVSKPFEPVQDELAAIQHALAHPTGSLPLREVARPGQRACIVFTDITRSSPDHLLVPALLVELEAAGVRDEDITLLCGIGMHRPSRPAGQRRTCSSLRRPWSGQAGLSSSRRGAKKALGQGWASSAF